MRGTPTMMKPLIGVGLWGLQATRWYPRPHRQIYKEMIEELQQAENLGFDFALFTEHHFANDGSCPSILLPAAAASRMTSRIGIGTGLLLLPLHDKEKIKEQVVAIDSLLAERLILGVGLGYRDIEFVARSQPRRARVSLLEDHIQHLRSEVLRASGRKLEVWIGGHIETTARRAARLGSGVMLPSTLGHEELSTLFNIHRNNFVGDVGARWRSAGGMIRSVWVARTDAEAREYAIPRLNYLWQEQYGAWGMFDDIKRSGEADNRGDGVSQAGQFAIVGSPDTVAKELVQIISSGAQHVICRIQTGTQSHDEIAGCLDLLGREVLPQIRETATCA
jgi:alkanesulfonate monooxygenase SsuD/methylene tetrahydromethanopterin reductase-like flavin-dependent oxidoreductase (luciferase family)